MSTKHAKSPCCRGKIIKYGRRRRQCTACGKTWRLRPKKQGRKKKRYSSKLLEKYLDRQIPSIQVLSKLRVTSQSKLSARLRQELLEYVRKTPWPKAPQGKELIAIADAMIQMINGKTHAIYFILLREIDSNRAVITKPFIMAGTESSPGWKKAFGKLPKKIFTSIKAIVCDGHLGFYCLAKANNWVIQRCHFHLLSSLQGRRSKSKYSQHRKTGSLIYQAASSIINTRNKRTISCELNKFRKIIPTVSSPRFKSMLSGFIRDHRDYQSYLKHPELKLPRTSNAAESVISTVRNLCYRARGFRTKKSFKLWIYALAKHRKQIVCNGHLPTK